MSDTPLALLDEADACHDDEPARAADMLRRIDPSALPADRLPGLAFLFNHVLGEKFGAWAEAHGLHAAVLRAAGPSPAIGLWRQAATAAQLAHDDAEAARLTAALGAASGATLAQAQDVVTLTAAMYRLPTQAASDRAATVEAASAPLAAPHWDGPGPLDAAVAACLNSIASTLVELPTAEARQEPLRATIEEAARLAERFWLRAGTWVHHERAAYLRAMAGNALGDAAAARGHALRALALLDANDTAQAESVDRAFIELERARACRDLALHAEAEAAQQSADALAAGFGDAGLDAWFAKRRAELGAPALPSG